MHEFNVCQTIVDSALAHMKGSGRPNVRLVKTTIVLGGLRQLVPEYLRSAYEQLTKGTRAEGSTLEIKLAPIEFTCAGCGKTTESNEARFRCASCGSQLGQVSGGREMYLESLEVEEDEEPAD
jgi:hydrogenase nickel incorporation protein HypA/HybF